MGHEQSLQEHPLIAEQVGVGGLALDQPPVGPLPVIVGRSFLDPQIATHGQIDQGGRDGHRADDLIDQQPGLGRAEPLGRDRLDHGPGRHPQGVGWPLVASDDPDQPAQHDQHDHQDPTGHPQGGRGHRERLGQAPALGKDRPGAGTTPVGNPTTTVRPSLGFNPEGPKVTLGPSGSLAGQARVAPTGPTEQATWAMAAGPRTRTEACSIGTSQWSRWRSRTARHGRRSRSGPSTR